MKKALRLLTPLFTAFLLAVVGFNCADDDDDDNGVNGNGEQNPTVLEIVNDNESLTTLDSALTAADLDSTLNHTGPLTLFAPTDSAFAALSEGLLDTLLNNPTGTLLSILQYHVVQDSIVSGDLAAGISVQTLQGASITVDTTATGDFVLNGTVGLVEVDKIARNGVVHLIDQVLIPPVQ
jgi:uncharacterized surface protein with fasciclin (FAS1) repeats